MRAFVLILLVCISLVCFSQQTPTAVPEAATAVDGRSNGMAVNSFDFDPTLDNFDFDRKRFEEVETPDDGLGPLYNAQSCRECHQNPVSGGSSQVTELRVGHMALDGTFENPIIPLGNTTEVVANRSLVNDRAIVCAQEIQERVPETETIRTTRLSLNLLGDGFVEAVPDQTFIDLARQQCADRNAKICGEAIMVPVIEGADPTTRVGRFGWKDQHASLLSFSADAYLNEMGITSTLLPTEVTQACNTDTKVPNNDENDIAHFAEFIRATAAPARDLVRAATGAAMRGSDLFDQIGCSICHVRTLVTAPAGTLINGGTFTIPQELGGKQFHPFSDFLLHDIGTGDGIVVITDESFGPVVKQKFHGNLPPKFSPSTANKLRTAPLWGLRFRPRMMHDGASFTFSDAIARHDGEAKAVAQNFRQLSPADQADLLEFLRSL